MAKSDLTLSSSFVAEFCQRLSRQSPVLHLARGWLEQRLGQQGLSIEQLVQLDSQNQAADQVSVSHSITSLRFLSAMDWKEFVESLSLVETTLLADPAGVYGLMDFATRDRYRHCVEFLARNTRLSEAQVAQRSIQLAADSARQNGARDRTAHVGFFLIDKGQAELARNLKVRWPWQTAMERSIHRFPLAFYAGGIGLLTLLAAFGFMRQSLAMGLEGWKFVFFTLVFLLCASQLAVTLMNWLSTLLVKPSLLPRMDYSDGIPEDCRTMVVVPTMLSSEVGVERLIEAVEIHHLANRDDHLHFALLTDFRDAPTEISPGDDLLLQRARAGIEMLNRKYVSNGQSLFFLFHRPRRWNASENLWMGYERKRGKLMEFNELLRGGARDCFSEIVGATAILPKIKYVITLDTDTQLPREAGRQLVGTMAHPLNRPVFDDARGIVREGYSILQPRVGVSLPSARRSWFVRLFAGDAGIDPYTREVSDVYQDVFREGSFIGKGIYDVDAFQRAMAGRFPENTILSHDLLEACHARSALVSDVEFYEEFPSRYNVDMQRRYRWIRGDWQITQWLLPRVPGSDARRIANPLSVLSQWKIFDNLRRSLVPVALLVLLLGSWLIVPELGALSLLLVVGIIALPGVLAAAVNALLKPHDLPWGMHLREVGASGARQLGQIFLTLAFLAYDAFISVDAISKTLVRLLVTHKRLLEWQTSSDSERTVRTDLADFYATMWVAPGIALAAGLFFVLRYPAQLTFALPLLVVWLAAPWIAWWISQPIASTAPDLSLAQLVFLRRTARLTWHFFDTFVCALENWLPPDNFQEIPVPTIATRTSPTNIGMALLANLAARDLGYLSLGGLMERAQATLTTMLRLERYRGHFYNWYETRTLKPLQPLYISSVDSGNLAGHLLTLASGLREQAGEKIFTPQIFAGLRDTVKVLQDLVSENKLLAQLDTELASAPTGLRASFALLQNAARQASQIAAALANGENETSRWAEILKRDCKAHLDDLLFLAPWLALPVATQLEEKFAQLDSACTLHEVTLLDQSPDSLAESTDAYARCLREAGNHARERLLALEALAKQCDEIAAMDFAFFIQCRAGFVFHRLQRYRTPVRHRLLRSARLRGAVVQLCCHRARTSASGSLVLNGAAAGLVARRTDSRFVERLNV